MTAVLTAGRKAPWKDGGQAGEKGGCSGKCAALKTACVSAASRDVSVASMAEMKGLAGVEKLDVLLAAGWVERKAFAKGE